MLHPLFSLLVKRPDLLLDHVSGYAALAQEEAAEAGTELLQRGLAWAVAGVCAMLFLMLSGVALMLGVMLHEFHWVLMAVPAVMLVLMVIAVTKAREPLQTVRFAELRAQVDRDAQALRQAA